MQKGAKKVLNKAFEAALDSAYESLDAALPGSGDVAMSIEKAARSQLKKKKNKKKKKTQQALSIVEVPNAYGSVVKNTKMTQRVSGNKVIIDMTVAPPNVIPNQAIWGAQDYATDPSKYRLYEYRLNPLDANIYPILPDTAKLYKKFRITKYDVQWTPAQGTSRSGRVAFVALSNGYKPLPSTFQEFISETNAEAVSSYMPHRYSPTPQVLLGNEPNKHWLCEVLPNRQNSGDYGSTVPAQLTAALQGTFLIAIEGLDSATNIAAGIGSTIIKLTVEFSENQVPDTATNVTAGFNLDHTFPNDLPLTSLSPYWRRSNTNPRKLVFVGQSRKFDIDVTLRSPISPSGFNPYLMFYDRDGSGKATTDFDVWNGTASGGDYVLHVDLTANYNFGDYFLLPPFASGEISIIFAPIGTGLSSTLD